MPRASAASSAAARSSLASAKLAAASPQRVSSSSVVARASTPSTTIAPLDSVAPTPKKGEKVRIGYWRRRERGVECRLERKKKEGPSPDVQKFCAC